MSTRPRMRRGPEATVRRGGAVALAAVAACLAAAAWPHAGGGVVPLPAAAAPPARPSPRPSQTVQPTPTPKPTHPLPTPTPAPTPIASATPVVLGTTSSSRTSTQSSSSATTTSAGASPDTSPSATGAVQGLGAGGAGGSSPPPLPSSPPEPATVRSTGPSALRGVVAGLGTVLLLSILPPLWRRVRRRELTPAAAGSAVALPMAEAGTAPAAFHIWRSDLDDLADLAALTAPPEERQAALRRRADFSAEELARRLTIDLEEAAKVDDEDGIPDD